MQICTATEELKAVRCCEVARTVSALLLVAAVNSSWSFEKKTTYFYIYKCKAAVGVQGFCLVACLVGIIK